MALTTAQKEALVASILAEEEEDITVDGTRTKIRARRVSEIRAGLELIDELDGATSGVSRIGLASFNPPGALDG